MLVHRGREEEDFTLNRSDFKDVTIIANRVAQPCCHVLYALEGHWCRLSTAAVLQRRARRGRTRRGYGCAIYSMRLARRKFRRVGAVAVMPHTWRAAMGVVPDPAHPRDELGRLRRRGTRQPPRWAVPAATCGSCGAILEHAAAQAPGGEGATERAAACDRCATRSTSHHALDQLADVEGRMTAALDTLGLTELVTTIDGCWGAGAAGAHPR